MAALDSLLDCMIRTAGLPAKVSILQWATSLRYQILTQVSRGPDFASTCMPLSTDSPGL